LCSRFRRPQWLFVVVDCPEHSRRASAAFGRLMNSRICSGDSTLPRCGLSAMGRPVAARHAVWLRQCHRWAHASAVHWLGREAHHLFLFPRRSPHGWRTRESLCQRPAKCHRSRGNSFPGGPALKTSEVSQTSQVYGLPGLGGLFSNSFQSSPAPGYLQGFLGRQPYLVQVEGFTDEPSISALGQPFLDGLVLRVEIAGDYDDSSLGIYLFDLV